MLKMGQMCHCKSTVIKFDGGTGKVLWKRKRGKRFGDAKEGNQVDFCMALDEANNRLYTGGTATDGYDRAVVYRYGDIDTTAPSLDWRSNRNGLSSERSPPPTSTLEHYGRPIIIINADGYVILDTTAASASGISRYDPSNGNLLAITTLGSNAGPLFSGVSGTFYEYFSSLLQKYDSSLTVIATASGSYVDVAHLGGGFVGIGGATTGVGVWSSALGAPTKNNTAITGVRIISDGSRYAYILDAGVRKIDTSPATPSSVYNNTTLVNAGTGYVNAIYQTPACIDADGYIYVTRDPNTATKPRKIQKRDPADGSIVWEHDLGDHLEQILSAGGYCGLATGGGVVASFGRWYNSAGILKPRHVIALDASDGSVLWDDVHGPINQGFRDIAVDSSGNVYACGTLA